MEIAMDKPELSAPVRGSELLVNHKHRAALLLGLEAMPVGSEPSQIRPRLLSALALLEEVCSGNQRGLAGVSSAMLQRHRHSKREVSLEQVEQRQHQELALELRPTQEVSEIIVEVFLVTTTSSNLQSQRSPSTRQRLEVALVPVAALEPVL